MVRDDAARSVVLTGRGRAFSTGGDLRRMRTAVERLGDPDDTESATLPWQWIRYQFGAMARLRFTTRGFADGVSAVIEAASSR